MVEEFERPDMSPGRLENESFEDYKKRQKLIKRVTTHYLKRGQMMHLSKMIVPELDKEGKVVVDNKNRPILTNKVTRGRTYIKPKEDEKNTD